MTTSFGVGLVRHAALGILVLVLAGCSSGGSRSSELNAGGPVDASTAEASPIDVSPDVTADSLVEAEAGESSDGLWILVSGLVDGYEMPAGSFLDMDGNSVGVDGPCNRFGGEFGGKFSGNQSACEVGPDDEYDLNVIEERLMAAFFEPPAWEDNRLVFASDGIRLIYARVGSQSAEDLFSILDDPTQAGDPNDIVLDPEGGGTPAFQKLARLDHPVVEVSFFVAKISDQVCLVISTTKTGMWVCNAPREMARESFVYELGTSAGPTGIKAALIPGEFVESASRSELGLAQGNLLVVDPTISAGEYQLENEIGEVFLITVAG